MKTNILVTGTGFVSQHLVDYFSHKEDTKVTLCTRGKESDGIIRANLADLNDVEKLFWLKFDKIFHLAAQSSVHVSWEKPFSTVRENISSVVNLMEVFAGTKTKLIIAGSADVYKTKNTPLIETYELEARSPYALSKLCIDEFVRMTAVEKKVNCTLLRLFTHTGTSQSTNFALSSWAKQLAAIKYGTQEKKIMVGNLDVRRDYCNVRDCCRAYDLVSDSSEFGSVYNVCSGNAYLMKDLLNKLIEIANVDVEIVVDEKRVRKNDIMYLCGSYEKIKEKFGWEPLIPIEQTLQELFNYWKQHICV